MNAVVTIDDQTFAPALLTGADVVAMTRAGVLPEGRGYELVEGVLVSMAAVYAPHVDMTDTLLRFFFSRFPPEAAKVSSMASIFLDERVMLEPDICVYPAGMASNDVRGSDILLAIEVSDTTLRYDLGKKARLYASHDVGHYWVVDLEGQQIFVHAGPGEESYGSCRIHPFGSALPLPFAPEIALTL